MRDYDNPLPDCLPYDETVPLLVGLEAWSFFEELSECSAESQRAILNLMQAAATRSRIIKGLSAVRARNWDDYDDRPRLLVLGRPCPEE